MTKTFGNITVLVHGDGSITAEGRLLRICSESALNDLAEDISSAQCWLRDVRRRQADTETPEAPMP